ncbi:thioredoxin-like domain-containing protein [uncultured Bacteroides sp.]|uniref:TlpA family protein disulfide reductase n=1 Tax=uncultured Bacteroides sp. TaxID=162156 RepID=UPI0025DA5909|nr:thioredoxin-like domain-containing protein [uncultured Bacteroides sp.]
MRKLIFLLLLCITCMLRAQNVIDNPKFKFRSGSIYNITRIERTPDATRLHIHVIFRPHWWVMLGKNTYLEDADTGEKYYLTGSEGFELDKEVYTPDSGTLDFVLLFPPLPETTKKIHFLDDDEGDESHTFYISLEKKDAKASLFDKVSGNWMGMDDYYEWAFGIYDSLAVMDNRFYQYEAIRQKGKSMLFTLKDDRGDKVELELTPQKNGLCRIKKDKEPARLYSRDAGSMKAMQVEENESPVFRRDSVCLQGYIAGYDQKLGFTNGLIYVSNDLTREDYPMVVTLQPNGRFECKFEVNYPMVSSVVFNNNWVPFYIEPGQTITMYVDWEAVMARSRARDYYYPLHNVHYMGATAYIGRVLKYVDDLFVFRYEDFSKMQKELTPAQFAERCEPMFRRWSEQTDSLVAVNGYVGKAARLVRNTARISQGCKMLDFVMDRDYLARENKDNEVLKVKEDSTYYHFLRQMPLNDSLIVADRNFSTFINRLEYMNFGRAMGDTIGTKMDVVTYTYPEKSTLTYLKEHGAEFTPEQEELRKQHEERAGTTLERPIEELIAETKIWKELMEKYKDLFEAYRAEREEANGIKTKEKTPENQLRANSFFEDQRMKVGQLDTIVRYRPFVSQVIPLRSLPYNLKSLDEKYARYLLDKEKELIAHPFLFAEAERLYAKAFPQQNDSTYTLPEGPATDIFRNIIKAHAGKALFVDFWATFCGPCRGGIEHTASLRQQYKDHPEFQFIYITSDRESPEKTYNEYVEKNLKDEACYRIPQADYNYLRQLFHFNGIPHYEWIEKDGTVLRNSPGTYNLEKYLEQRFGSKK